MKTLAHEAIKSGLKQVAVVGLDDPMRSDYRERTRTASTVNGIALRLCHSMEEALQWMTDTLN